MHQSERGSTALVRGSALAALSLAGALAAARVFTAAAEPSWERVTGPGPGDPADVLMVLVAGLGTLPAPGWRSQPSPRCSPPSPAQRDRSRARLPGDWPRRPSGAASPSCSGRR